MALHAGAPGEWPSPRGLLFGFACVGIGQLVVLAYYVFRRYDAQLQFFFFSLLEDD